MFRYLKILGLAWIMGVSPAAAFEAVEHSEIGDAAFRAAVRQLERAGGSWAALSGQRFVHSGHENLSAVAAGREVARVSFGEFTAIYGDYALTFDEVNSPGFAERTKALKAITRGGDSSDYPAERDYAIELAINNVTHFSRKAAESYVADHTRALRLAAKPGRLWEALHYEALAQHSLHDLFAFGHILEDRELTDAFMQWRQDETSAIGLSRAQRSAIAVLAGKSMGAYVNFYHNAYNWRGAMMKNAAGDIWRGYGDGRYRIADAGCVRAGKVAERSCRDTATERQRQIIVHAASVSILSVLRTASGLPVEQTALFDAICYIPLAFWDTNKPFPPELQLYNIAVLSDEMAAQGRPIEKHGFDFSLGVLQFEPGEFRGGVDYAGYVQQKCGRG